MLKSIFVGLVILGFSTANFATTWPVGPGKLYKKPSAVASLVKNGDTVLIDAGVYAQDVCLLRAHHLYLSGVGGKAHLKAEGKAYGLKAIWVIQGDSTIVENIEFSECSVPDKNGAGIRLEATHLVVRSCYFHDNEDGILAGDNVNSHVLIEYCEFARNGFGDGQSHNLYINHVKSLTFQFNHSHDSKVGHLLKSRAHQNIIRYNVLNTGNADGSYEIDLPNGGQALILGNTIRQGPNSQNSNLIAYGLEGLSNPGSHEIILSHNTLINEKGSGNFVNLKDQTNKLVLLNNVFAGVGKPYNGLATNVLDQGNLANVSRNYFLFNNPSSADYHLSIQSPALNYSKIDFRNYPEWKPEWEYDLTRYIQKRRMEFWPDPGAFEFHELNLFENPIHGIYGKDFIIVHHVDQSVSDVKDLYCLDKTYEGHQGTDFALSGFEQMDNGVDVFSVDSGTVTSIADGLFDKETVSDTAKRLGNYLVIQHGENWHSYYAHLKKNSLLVKPGDKVRPGQKIASVGCSGNCTDPHLHFELWYDSTQVVDPYDGPCGNQFNFWKDPVPYDSSFHVWKSGLMSGVASLDSLRFHQNNQNIFNVNKDASISYWNLQYGVRKGDKLSVEWLDQNGVEKFQFDYVADKNYWYQYFWTYMSTTALGICDECRCRYFRNGQMVEEFVFSIKGSVAVSDPKEEFVFKVSGSMVLNQTDVLQKLKVLNLLGQTIFETEIEPGESLQLKHLSPGTYILTGAGGLNHIKALRVFIP